MTRQQELALHRRARRRRRHPGGPPPPGAGRLLLGLFGGLVLFGVLATGVAALVGAAKYDEYASGVVPPEVLLAGQPRGGARIYDRHGTVLYEFVDEFSGLRRPVPLDEISRWVQEATVATEDASFWDNNGLNYRGLVRAALENLTPLSGGELFEGSGGSSITQQLAKNVYIPREERTDRSIDRKLRETVIALELTEQYSKEQILEWYLNSIPYGGIYVGIEAAAQGYFDKSASELTLAESALLAGIPQQPATYDPIRNPSVAIARQHEVLDLMVRHGAITEQQAEAARNDRLTFRANRFEIEAPHFVLGRIADEITARFGERALFDDGLEVTTTIDLDLQHEAERIVEQWVSEFEEQSDGHNGALVAMDPHTGQILVYVGSRDYFRDDIEGRNDNAISLNSPGSTLKPFTYMTAFMHGWSTGTGIIDTPARVIDAATGEYFSPRNPSGNYQGVIPADQALGNSLNIPAFKAILHAGVDNTVSVLKQMGITTLDNPGGYGPALTLGGVDITLLDLTYAYSVLATGGVMRGQEVLTDYDPGERTLDPVALLRVEDADGEVLYEFEEPTERRVMAENFTYLVTSIISDGRNQCLTFGCGGLGIGRPAAQKTGTSEPFVDSRAIGDTWTFGYTPHLVAGMWAGNSDNSPMVNIVSTSISWRSWRDFMTYAVDALEMPPTGFERPPGVVERELCWPSGRLPSDLCPPDRRYTGLFAADVLAGDEEALVDTWWQEVEIDTRTGLLATPATPAFARERQVRLVLPPEEIANWDGLNEWALAAGIRDRIAPTEDDTARAGLVTLSSPQPGGVVRGQVTVSGRADSPDFESFVLEWGRGVQPTSWVSIRNSRAPVRGGVIGAWDTSPLPNGEYTLRLRVRDAELGDLRYAIPVVVDNGGAAPETDLAPYAQILSPWNGAALTGSTPISGLAGSGSLVEWVVEVGTGIAPSSWDVLARAGTATTNQTFTIWDTTTVADGVYTLRLTVRDSVLGTAVSTITVTVAN